MQKHERWAGSRFAEVGPVQSNPFDVGKAVTAFDLDRIRRISQCELDLIDDAEPLSPGAAQRRGRLAGESRERGLALGFILVARSN